MKIVNGFISVLLGVLSLYVMFFKAKSDVEIGIGFGLLLLAVIFLCFMMLEEQKEEIEMLRHKLLGRE
jgi:Ca2+/Na+ antiporter